jgi:ABC-2 type transport system permease protein
MFFAQLYNELWKLFGKKRTYIGFGAFVLAQSAMLLLFKYTHWQSHFERLLSINGYVASEYISALTVALFMLFPQAALLMPLYVALVGGDLIAKEAEDGTLRMILCRPISRVRLLIVKWLGGMIFAAVLVLALGITALGTARVLFPWGGMFVIAQTPDNTAFGIFAPGEGLALYAFSHLFMVVNAITMLSIAFMFSGFNMKPAAATILALSYFLADFIILHLPLLEEYHNWLVTHHFESWFLIFQQPTPWSQILQSEITLLAISATAFVIGAMGFHVRDIKS